MSKIQAWAQNWLGITKLKEMITDMAEVNRSALQTMLVEINESGNKIADVIDRLVTANDEGRQNEVNRLVQELTPARDFLRQLAAKGGDTTAVDAGEVVPALPPVGGEVPPAEDAATQEAVSQAEERFGGEDNTAGFSSSPGEPNS